MDFLIVLAVTVVFCVALRTPIMKVPVLFYALAIAVDVLYFAGSFSSMFRTLWIMLLPIMQKCTLALAFFFVVMFIGVFPRDGKVGQWMRPVRAELSIIACILALGHMFVYLESYLRSISNGGEHSAAVLIGLTVALVLLALLLVLGITSFKSLKRRMSAAGWVKLQKLAYVFFGLVFAHLLLMLLPSALEGSTATATNVIVYSALFILYAVARIARAVVDARAKKALQGE